jgi:CO/xanthine dehydrogenase Mo-binding subunit
MGHPLELAGDIGGDRNAKHPYEFPANRVAVRWLHDSVLRPSAMRGLGAPANVFAIESFVDELAAAANVDPLEFRLRYLKDPRAIAVLNKVADLVHWEPRKSKGPAKAGQAIPDVATGHGLAVMQYESEFSYVATAITADVDRSTGAVRVKHAAVAHDCGLVVNPDGLKNQIEGGTIQSISRALMEQVTWDQTHVTSVDWATYPILTFPGVPDAIDIALIDHPDAPAWGAGEPAACTVAAAIGNAIYDAIGVRLRELPFTNARVKQAMVAEARS